MDKREIARIVNDYIGEVRVRWSTEFNGFCTTDGTRYMAGDIEDVAAGILKGQRRDAETVTGQRLDANATAGNRR